MEPKDAELRYEPEPPTEPVVVTRRPVGEGEIVVLFQPHAQGKLRVSTLDE